MTMQQEIQEFSVTADVSSVPFLTSKWVKYEICDSNFKLLESRWKETSTCNFVINQAGIYLIRITGPDEELAQRLVELRDVEEVVIDFNAEDFDKEKSVGQDIHDQWPIIALTIFRRNSNEQWVRSNDIEFSQSYDDPYSKNGYLDRQSGIHSLLIEREGTHYKQFVILPPGRFEIKFKSDINIVSKPQFVLKINSSNSKANLLGKLLLNGDIIGAKNLMNFRDAEQLMREKGADYASAAIGGYYLLRFRKFEFLHNWTINLANWFPEMADGAIIHAWFMLNLENGRISEATLADRNNYENHEYLSGQGFRYWLLKAAKRGIPVYSEGIRLLYEGLTQLMYHEKGKDPPVAIARKKVKGYLDRLIPGQVFTMLVDFSPETIR